MPKEGANADTLLCGSGTGLGLQQQQFRRRRWAHDRTASLGRVPKKRLASPLGGSMPTIEEARESVKKTLKHAAEQAVVGLKRSVSRLTKPTRRTTSFHRFVLEMASQSNYTSAELAKHYKGLILTSGSNPRVRDKEGNTPLMLMCTVMLFNRELAEALMIADGDITRKECIDAFNVADATANIPAYEWISHYVDKETFQKVPSTWL